MVESSETSKKEICIFFFFFLRKVSFLEFTGITIQLPTIIKPELSNSEKYFCALVIAAVLTRVDTEES